MGSSGVSLIYIGMKHQNKPSKFGPAKHPKITSQPVSLEIIHLEVRRWLFSHTLAFLPICIQTHKLTDFCKQIKCFLSQAKRGEKKKDIPSIFECFAFLRATALPVNWQHGLVNLDMSRDGGVQSPVPLSLYDLSKFKS